MKNIFFLFLFLNFHCFSQSIERLVYQKYFEPIFTFEPSYIRENNIRNLETVLNTFNPLDTGFSSVVKEKHSFREDGRPIQKMVLEDNLVDQIDTDYSYDSLGNLVKMRVTKQRHMGNGTIYLNGFYDHKFYYNGNLLQTKRSLYNNGYSSEYEQIILDSLHYSVNLNKDSIVSIFEFSNFIGMQNQLLIAKEKSTMSKLIDRACDWPNSFISENQKIIQNVTGKKCIDLEFLKLIQDQSAPVFKKCSESNKENFSLKLHDSLAFVTHYNSGIWIDTLCKKIYLLNVFYWAQPRFTYETITFDYDFNILDQKKVNSTYEGSGYDFSEKQVTQNKYNTFGHRIYSHTETEVQNSNDQTEKLHIPVSISEEITNILFWY